MIDAPSITYELIDNVGWVYTIVHQGQSIIDPTRIIARGTFPNFSAAYSAARVTKREIYG